MDSLFDRQPPRSLATAGKNARPEARAPVAEPPASQPLDAMLHADQGRMFGGLSPTAFGAAFLDWSIHLANAPAHRWQLAAMALSTCQGETPTPVDYRFRGPGWQQLPFSAYAQAFQRAEAWWARAAAGPPGVSAANQRIVSFSLRQLMDMASPSNSPWLNPEVIAATIESGGKNFADGWENFLLDWHETLTGSPCGSDNFAIGVDLAATPGKVVFRNELIELIQYAPSTTEVWREPILIVPAWIMKYYILDLSAGNSLIRYLVGQGHTVFAISWRNPGAEMRDTSLDDYRVQGVMAALDVMSEICQDTAVHACGYCLGGTLLTIAAAAMARDGDHRLASMTLFCSQSDFTEAGELELFITADQLALLDDIMAVQGYLDSRQMAGAFQLLRSNDLIWSRLIKTYLLGKREHPNDLMAWNADGTRMPARMHSEYLRRLFLRDELAEGCFDVEGRPIAIEDIQAPIFAVGTETDHIAPWRSVYKLHLLNEGDITFVLTSGGHNAGVVSEPGHPRRHFRQHRRVPGAAYVGPDQWLDRVAPQDGSWWPAWAAWLAEHSSTKRRPPRMGSIRYPALEPAPGRYVHEH